MGDVGALITALRARRDVRPDRIGVVGFCMGGRVAFQAAVHHPAAIKAVVSFYGAGIGADTPAAPINGADRITAPVLALFGENDQMIPLDQVARIDETMQRLGKTAEVKVYQGAGHGFFCDERASYQPDAARDSWERVKTWFGKYLK